MNKTELINALAQITNATKADSEKMLDAFIDIIHKNINNDKGIKLVGFGTFAVSHRKARVGRDPQTGEKIDIPAHKVPVFRAGKKLKDSVKKEAN